MIQRYKTTLKRVVGEIISSIKCKALRDSPLFQSYVVFYVCVVLLL
jgi:hypothetical protein